MAKRLQQNTAHDLPALRKNLKSLQKQMQEYDAKIVSLTASIKQLHLIYEDACAKQCIDPTKNLEVQIYGLVS